MLFWAANIKTVTLMISEISDQSGGKDQFQTLSFKTYFNPSPAQPSMLDLLFNIYVYIYIYTYIYMYMYIYIFFLFCTKACEKLHQPVRNLSGIYGRFHSQTYTRECIRLQHSWFTIYIHTHIHIHITYTQ